MLKSVLVDVARKTPGLSRLVLKIDSLYSQLAQSNAERVRLERIVNGGGGGRPEPADFEEQIYGAIVRPGDLAFDVGANLGNVSRYLARLCGKNGKVVAFEPVWPTYEALCGRLAEDYGMDRAPIICVPFGAAEIDKIAEITLPDGKHGEATLAPVQSMASSNSSPGHVSLSARFVRLDGFAAASRLGIPNFAKIDVEGAEKFVIEGASEWLVSANPPAMLIELFAPWERMFNYTPWEVLRLLKAAGYTFFFQCPEGLVRHDPTEATPFPDLYKRGYNVVVVSEEKHPGAFGSLQKLLVGSGTSILPMYPAPLPNVITD
jgi:FkbM family methyltransferase